MLLEVTDSDDNLLDLVVCCEFLEPILTFQEGLKESKSAILNCTTEILTNIQASVHLLATLH